MERISRSIKNVAEGISFGPASGFVVAPIRKLAEAFEGFATGGREVLGVNQASPSVMRELKCPNQINTSRRGFNDDELRGMPMLTVLDQVVSFLIDKFIYLNNILFFF